MSVNVTKVLGREKPLRLIAGGQPKTLAFESHLASAKLKPLNSPPRKLGAYNSGSASPVSGHSTLVGSPVKNTHKNCFELAGLEESLVVLTIPINKFRHLEKTFNVYLNSFMMKDEGSFFDFLCHIALGGFACFADRVLQASKQLFLIVLPLVLICSVKLILKPAESNLFRGSIDVPLKEANVPMQTRLAVYHSLIFSLSLLVVAIFKATALFKERANYASVVDVTTLSLLGVLLITLTFSLFTRMLSLLHSDQK